MEFVLAKICTLRWKMPNKKRSFGVKSSALGLMERKLPSRKSVDNFGG